MKFRDRTLTTSVTEEFIEQGTDIPLTKAEEEIENALDQFEQSYQAVGEFNHRTRGHVPEYEIKAIASRDADLEEIQRGLQTIIYWLSNYEN